MSSFWKKIRSDFPITKRCIYLDHASAGPISRPVSEAYEKYAKTHLCEADFSWPQWIKKREEIRCKVARFINADPSEITFTSSTSHGMNLIADLISNEGAVLTNTNEFPSSTVPWIWRKTRMVYQKDENFSLPISDLKKLLSPKIKTILSSYVQYATGFKQDIKALGNMKKGRYLVVNATQGFGSFPVDVKEWKADFLCTNSYKWLMGGYGSGILFVRKKWLSRFKPSFLGWRSVEYPDRMNNRNTDIHPNAVRNEWGCPAFPSIFAFGAAVDYVSEIGIKKVAKRIIELTDFAIERLEDENFEVVSPRSSKHRSGIVVFKAPQALKVTRELLAKGIYVSARGAGIRLAPHFYNSLEEIDSFVKKLKSITKKIKA